MKKFDIFNRGLKKGEWIWLSNVKIPAILVAWPDSGLCYAISTRQYCGWNDGSEESKRTRWENHSYLSWAAEVLQWEDERSWSCRFLKSSSNHNPSVPQMVAFGMVLQVIGYCIDQLKNSSWWKLMRQDVISAIDTFTMYASNAFTKNETGMHFLHREREKCIIVKNDFCMRFRSKCKSFWILCNLQVICTNILEFGLDVCIQWKNEFVQMIKDLDLFLNDGELFGFRMWNSNNDDDLGKDLRKGSESRKVLKCMAFLSEEVQED
jgi:hypothetical protein